VLEGLRGDDSIAELCRKEGIAQSLYYTWSKEFMEAGKRRLAGDTARSATTDEVKDLRRQARDLKEFVAEQTLELRLLKKSCSRMGKTKNEISRIREAGDHQAGGTIPPSCQGNAGYAGHCPSYLLSPVRPLSALRRSSVGGSKARTATCMEPRT